MKPKKVRLPEHIEAELREIKLGQESMRDGLKTLNKGLDTLIKGMVTLVEQMGSTTKDFHVASRREDPPQHS